MSQPLTEKKKKAKLTQLFMQPFPTPISLEKLIPAGVLRITTSSIILSDIGKISFPETTNMRPKE